MSLYNNAYVIKSCNVLIFCEEFGRGFYKLKKKNQLKDRGYEMKRRLQHPERVRDFASEWFL